LLRWADEIARKENAPFPLRRERAGAWAVGERCVALARGGIRAVGRNDHSAKRDARRRRAALTRLHQLALIFAIFGVCEHDK
jgi:hypothetical protein